MAAATPVYYDRVQETTTTTGTGTLTLAGAVAGFQSFAVVGDKGLCAFCTTDGTNWETALGKYAVSGTTLTRDTILASSNSGNAVNWGAGTKNVFLTRPAAADLNTILPPGPASNWTWVNQNSSTVTDGVNGFVQLSIQHNATLSWTLLTKTPPATPYTILARLQCQQYYANSYASGVYFYDGTKLMGLEFVTQAANAYTLRVEKITNVTTDGSTPFSVTNATFNPFSGAASVRLRNDGSTLFFDVSLDGQLFTTLFSEAVGTFLTPTKVGYGGVSNNASTLNTTISLHSWAMLTA